MRGLGEEEEKEEEDGDVSQLLQRAKVKNKVRLQKASCNRAQKKKRNTYVTFH